MTPTAKYTPLSGLAFCSVQLIQVLGCALYGLPLGILHHVGIDFDPSRCTALGCAISDAIFNAELSRGFPADRCSSLTVSLLGQRSTVLPLLTSERICRAAPHSQVVIRPEVNQEKSPCRCRYSTDCAAKICAHTSWCSEWL